MGGIIWRIRSKWEPIEERKKKEGRSEIEREKEGEDFVLGKKKKRTSNRKEKRDIRVYKISLKKL